MRIHLTFISSILRLINKRSMLCALVGGNIMGSPRNIEKISQIIAYIISLMGGKAHSKTQIVKLLYLIDVVSFRRNGKPVTGINFKSYYYGPYSSDIEDALDSLSNQGYITGEKKITGEGRPYFVYTLNNLPNFNQIKQNEKNIIEECVKPLLKLSLSQLLDMAYKTKEFEAVSFGENISFAKT